MYVAVQPHDYDRPIGSDSRLDTMFGWRAPAIDAHDLVERDRLYVVFAGWLLIGLLASRVRPSLWRWIGVCVVVPTLIVYFPTAPHDAEGYWTLNVVYLPIVGFCVAAAAKAATEAGPAVANPLLLSGIAGALFAAALLVGGGESNGVIAGVAIGAALVTATACVGTRQLSRFSSA